ncbi:UBAP1-MVB12-associated (UMA)-domain containing protein 1 [Rhineura floridana]|uniref:UBAP1-MVB12-associated (UMA)-domain containing protein 1 n=1 Tax=Rhineura floridana TaxID=261503 RepID=UPI002AC88D87|nr:UBAP1-MVB12-associated (UMA)-domain containing protein 1 [Rhineura floridana]
MRASAGWAAFETTRLLQFSPQDVSLLNPEAEVVAEKWLPEVGDQADLYFKEMFNFFRKSQDTKKVPVTDKEADGFVLLGNTINEESDDSQDKTSLYVTGPEGDQTSQTNSTNQPKLTEVGTEKNQNMESNSSMLELLSDVPFTLAPHVLAVQDACNDFPRQLLSCDVSDNLTRFWYDFTLENSVLCES